MGNDKKMILIADPDRDVLRDLGNALHDQGYDVRAAVDGSKALEKAIMVHPDLVLFDENCPLIPAKKFVQIIRSNPQTENIPVVVMLHGEKEGGFAGYREDVLHKPFNNDEVLAQVAAIFRRMVTAQEVRDVNREISGSLAQISLGDLLQIFAMNRKTGQLELKHNGADGHIFVQEGNVVHALTRKHKGEKALFRLLQWREGSFAFLPERVSSDASIRRSTDALLLESARQADELERLRIDLPSENVRLEVEPDIKLRYEGLHPVTQQIVDLLEFYNTLGEVVENSTASDFETYRAVQTLLEKGVLQAVATEEGDEEEEPLLRQDLLYELKIKIAAGFRSRARVTRAKVCMLCGDQKMLKDFVGGMRKLPGMELTGQTETVKRGFGELGVLHMSENLELSWILLPHDLALRPLWQPLGAGMVGGLVLLSGLDDQVLYRLNTLSRELAQNQSIPLLQLAPEALGPDEKGLLEKGTWVEPSKVRTVVVQLLLQIVS